MKKIGMIVSTLSILFLSACGSSGTKTVCTMEVESIKSEAVVEGNKDGEVTKTKATQTFTKEALKASGIEAKDATKQFKSGIKDYEADGISAEVKEEDGEVSTILTFDLEKMKKDDIETSGIDKKVKDTVKNLEDNGYKCKEK